LTLFINNIINNVLTKERKMKNIMKRINKYIEYRKTYYELASLDDRDLKDLGIFRSNIKDIAKGNSSE
jgi:uncharacterized protein YjiS (DUF1127 family)